jgi:hypothetical protein
LPKHRVGRIKFKNHWDELSEAELFWYINHAAPMLANALEVETKGFDDEVKIKDMQSWFNYQYGCLTACCQNRKKLFKLKAEVVSELLNEGITNFFTDLPEFEDDLEDKLNAMVVGQFAFADMFYRAFNDTEQDKELNLFYANFQQWDKNTVVERADKYKRTSTRTKRLVAL